MSTLHSLCGLNVRNTGTAVNGRLLAISIGNGKLVDFERAMKYSLAPIPLSIRNSDVTMGKASKSVLMKETLTNLDTTAEPDSHVDNWYI